MVEEKAVEVVPANERTDVEKRDEPPVVARLVVEIRSDGSRTIARGVLQDAILGKEVAVRAEGTTPLSLALSLARAMLKTPSLSTAFSGALKALRGKKT
jgi:hypothetical protein